MTSNDHKALDETVLDIFKDERALTMYLGLLSLIAPELKPQLNAVIFIAHMQGTTEMLPVLDNVIDRRDELSTVVKDVNELFNSGRLVLEEATSEDRKNFTALKKKN